MRTPATWILGVLLLLLAALVGATFQTQGVVAAAFTLAAVLVLVRSRRRTRRAYAEGPPPHSMATAVPQVPAGADGADRSTPESPTRRLAVGISIGVVLAAMVASVVAWRMQVADSDTSVTLVAFDAIAHGALLAGLLIWVLTLSRGHIALLPLGLGVVMACLAGGAAGMTQVSRSAVAIAAALGFAVVAQLVLRQRSHDAISVPTTGVKFFPRALWGGGINDVLAAVVLCVALISTSLLSGATRQVLPDLQQRVVRYVTESLERANPTVGMGEGRYVTGSRIGAIRTQMLISPQGLALRGFSDSPPGYLRGSTFERYDERRWATQEPSGRYTSRGREMPQRLLPQGPPTVAQTRAGRLQLRQFRFTEPTAEPQTMVEIHAIPEKGPVVFTPLATRWMKAAALSLAVSEDHIVLDGVDLRYPYVVGVTPSIPIETLSPEREEELLWVPPELRRVTDQLVDELCPPEASTREKAVAVSQFFQNQFDYSLEHSTRAGRREPIEHFLRSRHPAHCEYFATATALILRRAGVPTRYVTGYVMAELDPRDRSWIARNGNAHAWVEAYDRHASQWFPVESTPGRQYQTLRSGRVPDIANNSADPATPQADKRDTKSWYQRLGQWLQGLQWASALALILRIAGVPLLVFLILLLWRMIREEGRAGLAPIDFRSLEMLRSVNRRIERHGLVRADQETLHQFAHRLDAEAEQVGGAKAEELHQAAAWYRRYASARYRGLEPQPFSLRAAV